MATPGYNTQIKLSGDASSMTDEAMSDTGDGLTFRVDDPEREIFNPSTSMTVKVDGTSEPPTNYEIHYLTGAVTFSSSKAGSTVTITGEFLPAYPVAAAVSNSVSRSYGGVELTQYHDEGRRYDYGLQEFEASITQLDTDVDPLDGQGGSEDSVLDILGGRQVVVEYQPSGLASVTSGARQGRVIRAWSIMPTSEESSEVDGRAEAALSFEGSLPDIAMTSQTIRLFDSFNTQ